ncbi:DUF5320 domain-containing protein [Methanocalculus chunghsingensis]|uniref:DUF5320 domain-containing protein n=1 Tax=Methanocalculus chunghsingensis TaxID=156457 RepID=UPI001B8C3F32|nr:DUF5320 domain-containing protein [Methanocalculus chunghsingensis]
MPGLDGRGPLGMGPMTGRRMGRCVSPSSNAQSEQIVYGLGRGGIPRGRGRGLGRGWVQRRLL